MEDFDTRNLEISRRSKAAKQRVADLMLSFARGEATKKDLEDAKKALQSCDREMNALIKEMKAA